MITSTYEVLRDDLLATADGMVVFVVDQAGQHYQRRDGEWVPVAPP